MEDPTPNFIRSIAYAVGQPSRIGNEVHKLTKDVKARIQVLTRLHKQRAEMQMEYQKELYALEFKYAKQYSTNYHQQRQIITDESSECGDDVTNHKCTGDMQPKGNKSNNEKNLETTVGIPCYWLNALKNSPIITDLITEEDEKVLEYLIDIKCSYSKKLSSPGFRLLFVFKRNPYIKSTVLSKQFAMCFYSTTENLNEYGPMKLVSSNASELDWITPHNKSNDCLVGKKSFFNIFRDVNPISTDSQAYEELTEDYELCLYIKDRILPYSVYWYTGEALS